MVYQNDDTQSMQRGAYIEDYTSDDENPTNIFANDAWKNERGKKQVVVEILRAQKSKEALVPMTTTVPVVTMMPPTDPSETQARSQGQSIL